MIFRKYFGWLLNGGWLSCSLCCYVVVICYILCLKTLCVAWARCCFMIFHQYTHISAHDRSPPNCYSLCCCSRALEISLFWRLLTFGQLFFFISIFLKYISSTLFTVYLFLFFICRELIGLNALKELPDSFGRLGNLTTLCVFPHTLLIWWTRQLNNTVRQLNNTVLFRARFFFFDYYYILVWQTSMLLNAVGLGV